MDKGEDHFVVGNGVIKSKVEIKVGSANGTKGGAHDPTVIGTTSTKKLKKKGKRKGDVSDNGAHVDQKDTCSDKNNNNKRENPNDSDAPPEQPLDNDSVTPTDYKDARTSSGSESDDEAEKAEPVVQKQTRAKSTLKPPTPAATPSAENDKPTTDKPKTNKKDTPKAPKAPPLKKDDKNKEKPKKKKST